MFLIDAIRTSSSDSFLEDGHMSSPQRHPCTTNSLSLFFQELLGAVVFLPDATEPTPHPHPPCSQSWASPSFPPLSPLQAGGPAVCTPSAHLGLLPSLPSPPPSRTHRGSSRPRGVQSGSLWCFLFLFLRIIY